ncbi:hypothetical protein MSTE_03782 [Mycobacteroides stephanolepidis]|uniref:Uncharacterized protein n=2 Tax=[Mycobacterium] stephanolepidis TaxID=1520670 RepID=A0A1Z4F1J7_9MYCO|nr:hypothetical protein MSTE_03782 [[Mycobacterium] stephanolepidis]
MNELIPIENDQNFAKLQEGFAKAGGELDGDLARLSSLGQRMAELDRQVLEESCTALAEMGFDSAAIAVREVLDRIYEDDTALVVK